MTAVQTFDSQPAVDSFLASGHLEQIINIGTDAEPPANVYEYLKLLWPEPFKGYLECTVKDSHLRSRPFAATMLEEAADYLEKASRLADVYITIGLQEHAVEKRQKANTVVSVPALFFDLDHKNPANPAAHKQEDLPRSREEALDFVSALPLPPSFVVNTGNGLAIWWLYDRPWTFNGDDGERANAANLSKYWQEMVIANGRKRGWKFDNTADLVRLTRPAGTLNHKGAPLPVHILEFTDRRYSVEEIKAQLPEAPRTSPVAVVPPVAALATGTKDDEVEATADPNIVIASCPWLQHCKGDAASLTEPEWKMASTVIARCRGGREKFHQMSTPYPNYSKAETDLKIDQSLRSGGPVTCETVSRALGCGDYCDSCAFRGRVKSPIVLGMQTFQKFKDWIYVQSHDEYRNLATGQALKRAIFTEAMRSQMPSNEPASIAFNRSKSTTQVAQPIFRPNAPTFIENNGLRMLNLWQKPKIQPQDGDCSVFLDHLAYLFPNEEERKMLHDVLAFCVQRPGHLLGYMTLIQGTQGTGKSYLGQVMNKIVGPANVRTIRSGDLNTRFNDWIEGAALVIIEELMTPGRMEVANNLKPLITQPTVRIEKKHVSAYEVDNCAKFLAFTNHSISTYLSEDDRRTLVLKSPATKRDASYYGGLFDWTEANAGVILNHLLQHDLANFQPMASAPMTDAKRRLIEDSRPPVEAELIRMIEEAIPPFNKDVVRLEDTRTVCNDLDRVPMAKIAQSLTQLRAVRLEQVRLSDGRRARYWVVRNIDAWAEEVDGKWRARNIAAIEAHLKGCLSRLTVVPAV